MEEAAVRNTRFYVLWMEAITAKASGAEEQLRSLLEWAEAIEPNGGNGSAFIRTFVANFEALAMAPMEPQKDHKGHYVSYNLYTGENFAIEGLPYVRPNPRYIVLFGEELCLNQLVASIEDLRGKSNIPMPDISKFTGVFQNNKGLVLESVTASPGFGR